MLISVITFGAMTGLCLGIGFLIGYTVCYNCLAQKKLKVEKIEKLTKELSKEVKEKLDMAFYKSFLENIDINSIYHA